MDAAKYAPSARRKKEKPSNLRMRFWEHLMAKAGGGGGVTPLDPSQGPQSPPQQSPSGKSAEKVNRTMRRRDKKAKTVAESTEQQATQDVPEEKEKENGEQVSQPAANPELTEKTCKAGRKKKGPPPGVARVDEDLQIRTVFEQIDEKICRPAHIKTKHYKLKWKEGSEPNSSGSDTLVKIETKDQGNKEELPDDDLEPASSDVSGKTPHMPTEIKPNGEGATDEFTRTVFEQIDPNMMRPAIQKERAVKLKWKVVENKDSKEVTEKKSGDGEPDAEEKEKEKAPPSSGTDSGGKNSGSGEEIVEDKKKKETEKQNAKKKKEEEVPKAKKVDEAATGRRQRKKKKEVVKEKTKAELAEEEKEKKEQSKAFKVAGADRAVRLKKKKRKGSKEPIEKEKKEEKKDEKKDEKKEEKKEEKTEEQKKEILKTYFKNGMKAEDTTNQILELLEKGIDKILDTILFRAEEIDTPIDNDMRWFLINRTTAKAAILDCMLSFPQYLPFAWGGTVYTATSVMTQI